ncbi:phytanoyl-CoA dioxygenase family protein [Streptomyces hirsutus]|uniref:phytanoyl-CoA dioxygenase family protein n=1 Tax=Streptomyces hirsutus TaxID=35620 RepID=UPI0006E25F8F|nr:phytanoyl-CoA dioxygenase family protein [Streptomyces hirsutus]
MTATLAESRVEDYRRDGFLFPMRAMSAEQAASYRARLEAFEAEHGPQAGSVLRSKSHLVLPWVNEIIRLDPVLDVVESIIGPDIYCWGSSFFIKDPHHPGFVAWHQDAPFSNIPAGGEMLTAWIALAPSIPENGCLKVVAGTHTEQAPHSFVEGTDNLLSQGQEIAVEVNEDDATSLVLEPGEFSLHHQFIFHGSAPSRSDQRRVGIAVRYMAPYEREGEPTDYATLVRGEDPYNAFIPEPVPSSDMDPAAVAYRNDQLVRLHGDRYRTTM